MTWSLWCRNPVKLNMLQGLGFALLRIPDQRDCVGGHSMARRLAPAHACPYRTGAIEPENARKLLTSMETVAGGEPNWNPNALGTLGPWPKQRTHPVQSPQGDRLTQNPNPPESPKLVMWSVDVSGWLIFTNADSINSYHVHSCVLCSSSFSSLQL